MNMGQHGLVDIAFTAAYSQLQSRCALQLAGEILPELLREKSTHCVSFWMLLYTPAFQSTVQRCWEGEAVDDLYTTFLVQGQYI